MFLKDTRKQYGLTQKEAADIADVPLRTYVRYEKDEAYGNVLIRHGMVNKINDRCEITERKGILTIKQISSAINEVIKDEYSDSIDLCYLFGSYAKGYATETSDVDLCVSTTLTGLNFVGLSESIRSKLHKKIDLIRLSSLNNNLPLIKEIMKDGIKIYS
ncbi:MAG: helix-turn-helix domain-containing protein [Erysipelotrichaceae bacterium]|nr:helix-turn-helix domain-containing protein [Erysipelotrichaceae bacterium]